MNHRIHGPVVVILAAVTASPVQSDVELATGQSSLPSVSPGDHSFTIRVGESDRRYTVHVPPGYTGQQAVPVVIMLHGGGGTGRAAATETGWNAQADQAVFLAVFPEALARDPAKRSSFAGNPLSALGLAESSTAGHGASETPETSAGDVRRVVACPFGRGSDRRSRGT